MYPPYRCARLPGDVAIAVPESLDLLTPYVLEEQQDWFEDEIKFVRRLLEPGMAAIDIGANYGVYALTMARLVGDTGRVWAFEPAHSTAAYVNASIDLNQFRNLHLVELGLSNRHALAELHVGVNSELSTLAGSADGDAGRESIELRTLDACAAEYGMRPIDFVKLDAEGEEERILEGGRQFFEEQDPLVMFEVKHADEVQTGLVPLFRRLGYAPYRLVPGLQVLAPFSGAHADPSWLNLFAARPNRAAHLESRALLVSHPPADDALPEADALFWDRFGDQPYAQGRANTWQHATRRAGRETYIGGLSDFFAAHGLADAPVGSRYAYLRRAFDRLEASVAVDPTFPRLQSLARIAGELGLRTMAVSALTRLFDAFMAGQLELDEPFVPVSARFDRIDPGTAISKWCLAAILEEREKLRAFSTYFTRQTSLAALRLAQKLGFADDELNRRLELIQLL